MDTACSERDQMQQYTLEGLALCSVTAHPVLASLSHLNSLRETLLSRWDYHWGKVPQASSRKSPEVSLNVPQGREEGHSKDS